MQSREEVEVDKTYETRSVVSRSSTTSSRSNRSTASMAAAKARARAEAARTRASFVKKETEMKLEKVRMEGALLALEHEKEAAAAIAEAKVLEDAIQLTIDEGDLCVSQDIVPQVDPTDRTSEYVEQFSSLQNATELTAKTEPMTTPMTPVGDINCKVSQPQHSSERDISSMPPSQQRYGDNSNQNASYPDQNQPLWSHIPLDYQHLPQSHEARIPTDGHAGISDTARFLTRRELITSALVKFDDRPENYWAWKSSFFSAKDGLNLSYTEELDLLIRWLGFQSSEYVRRIRAVHIKHPDVGLRMAWERLEETYGSPEVVEKALLDKIERFPKVNKQDSLKLRELGDLLREIQSAKSEGYLAGLSYLDTSRGVNPIVEKLPYHLQEKWIYNGSQYKKRYNVSFPPFSFFVDFVNDEAKARNDPSFSLSSFNTNQSKSDSFFKANRKISVTTHKTGVAQANGFLAVGSADQSVDVGKQCPMHKRKPHALRHCRAFRAKPLEERKLFLKENGVCYRCCSSTSHTAKNCNVDVKCSECESVRHVSALHPGLPPWLKESSTKEYGGEEGNTPTAEVTTNCTEVCGTKTGPRSCSKICLIKVYPSGHPENMVRMYVVLDDQSNRSLATTELFDLFRVTGQEHPYTLRTCAGVMETSGRRATGFMAESIDGRTQVSLPTLIECNHVPDERSEIPSTEIAHKFPHLKTMAHEIPEIDPNAQILLLLGRDILQVHKVRESRNGPQNAPYAQRLDFGWVIVGDVCLGSAHKPGIVSTFRTNILSNGRPSLCTPCPNHIRVKEDLTCMSYEGSSQQSSYFHSKSKKEQTLGSTVFEQTQNDDKVDLSVEDRMFLAIMEKEVFMDDSNSWVAPLPFREPRQRLPSNKGYAAKRLRSLCRSLEKNPSMQEHFVTFMQRIFDQNHAEPAPPLEDGEEAWYLPFFGVYHPRKPGQIRVVFDSSAQFKGLSLNQVLLSGPDLNNSLVGVLLRFRKEAVAITADIEQMFHSFVVRKDHRNFLRFLWFEDNDVTKEIIDYRMTVHVFGNSPSPAVAIYGLHRAAQKENEYGKDAKDFVEHDFYCDDALKSVPTVEEAVDLLQRTQEMLASSNLRLHKIASNIPDVMNAFPAGDRAKGLKDLDLKVDTPPIQRSLGLCWNLKSDTFTFHVAAEDKPFTRRGVLAMVNSIFDPLGFVAPVTIRGKLILRELTARSTDWDSPLPVDKESEWKNWRNSLQDLGQFEIPRVYSSVPPSSAQKTEVHVFSDASTKAIAAVAYLRTLDANGKCDVGFLLGKAKLAPLSALTVPRLELGAAVLAVEVAELVLSEMDITPDVVDFYSDSRVVLGYIHNQTQRFYVYVSNRVQRIRKSTKPEQWHYVPTSLNPADQATRSVPASDMNDSTWISGPAFLLNPKAKLLSDEQPYDLVDPDHDEEVRSNCTILTTSSAHAKLEAKRFEKFSTWKSLTQGVSRLIHIAHSHKLSKEDQGGTCKGWHYCDKSHMSDEMSLAKAVIIASVQQEAYSAELDCILSRKEVSKTSNLRKLNPILDQEGLLRVGGRLIHAPIEKDEKHPLVIPGKSHIAILLVRHFHERVKHQGRLFTEGAVRSAGFWIVGGKRCINSVIYNCVVCKKLRGRVVEQKMADLPPDRLNMDPPFTYVGIDVFGPWSVNARRTRGGLANSKRWVVIFTCLSIRAVHFELIESLDAASFINALRRFFALRGPAKQIRSDCGTNFVGACKELNMMSEQPHVKSYLSAEGCKWVFNPPHASHMGGAWERLIGVARRILDSMLMQTSCSQLTHEVLSTLMAEVSAIMNARPLTPISSDPDSPDLLTPAMLLTQKSGTLSCPPGEFDKDLSRNRWKQVQHLANVFWERWRREYIVTLQNRRKWHSDKPNVKAGDLVLMKDDQAKRNEWPLGLVTKVFPSSDGRVRKIELKVTKNGTSKIFLRPVHQVILLMSPEKDK